MDRVMCVLAVLAAGCSQELEARVGGAVLPQANGVTAARVDDRAGPLVVVTPGGAVPALAAGPVRLAIDLRVPWTEMRAVLARADEVGARPVVLVGQRAARRGFEIADPIDRERFALRLRPTGTGKFCLSPPGTREAYCVESADRRHISALYVREAVQKAVLEYRIMQAWVVPDDDARWGDIVRTMDGARTCCGKQPFAVAVAR